MATEAEKQKQRAVQAELDRMEEHGWARFMALKAVNEEFAVQFTWKNGVTRTDARARRTADLPKGSWQVLLPNDVFESAFQLLQTGALKTLNKGKHGAEWLKKIEPLLVSWDNQGRSKKWVPGPPAAALLRAAKGESQIRADGYKDFLFEHEGVFVALAYERETPKGKKPTPEPPGIHVARIGETWGLRIPSRGVGEQFKHKDDVEKVIRAAAELNVPILKFVWLKKEGKFLAERSNVIEVATNQDVGDIYNRLSARADGHKTSNLHARLLVNDEARHQELFSRVLKPDGSRRVETHWLAKSVNVVLEGVPGTGKTHAIGELKTAAFRATGSGDRPLSSVSTRFMTMHPSTSYEDFVEGLRPFGNWTNTTSTRPIVEQDHSADAILLDEEAAVMDASKLNEQESSAARPGWFSQTVTSAPKGSATFALKNGFFIEACVAAVRSPNTAVVVVLDELNRCNIPKVLGDLMTVIEESKRAHWDETKKAWVVDSPTKAVTLPYSGRKLFVPDNLFVVGTMNTTDRSVAPMDAALRRRFSFHRLWPQGFGNRDRKADRSERLLLVDRLKKQSENKHTDALTGSSNLWLEINTVLLDKYGADAMLGHSYLDDLSRALARANDKVSDVVEHHWNHRILPQLMDVIASNGLTRSLVNDPRAFFDHNPKAKAGTGTLASPATVFDGRIDVSFSGTGSQRMAHLTFLKLEPDPPGKKPTNGLGAPVEVAASDDAAGDE
jgi:MoxR-like ATPase